MSFWHAQRGVQVQPGATFWRNLTTQQRVLHALFMREVITRFGRDNLGVLWLAAEPMIFTLGVATLWTTAGLAHTTTIPPVAFAVTGYSSVLMWRNAAGHSSMAVEANKALLFHRSVLAIDVILTRIALEVVGASCSFLVLSLVFISIGSMPVPTDLFKVLIGWMMLAWLGASIALLIGAGTAFTPVIERLWIPVAYLMFPLSGAGFMVEWLPARLQALVQYVPMVHGIELLREGYFGNAVRTHYDITYMASCCLVLTLIGLLLLREAARRVEI
jgi:ABC-type polysaccharide/polyol phosphate export permease